MHDARAQRHGMAPHIQDAKKAKTKKTKKECVFLSLTIYGADFFKTMKKSASSLAPPLKIGPSSQISSFVIGSAPKTFF